MSFSNLFIKDGIGKLELSELSQALDAIFNYSHSAIELYDTDGKLLDINQSSLSIFGIESKKEIESFNFYDDPNITPERRNELNEGKAVKYKTVIDFDEVKKKNIFKTNKSGKVSLDVVIIPIKENEKISRILFIGNPV